MRPQREKLNHHAVAKIAVIIPLVVLIIVNLPSSNDAAQHIPNNPKCNQYCVQGMDCSGCCRQTYRNNFATGSCDWSSQPYKCMCGLPMRRPSFARTARRGVKKQRQTRSTKGCCVPWWPGSKNKPEPLCLKEFNAARQNGGTSLLIYNRGLEAAAKYTVNYIARYDCLANSCPDMVSPAERVGFLTKRKLKRFKQAVLSNRLCEKEDCNVILNKLFADSSSKLHLLNPLHTEIGCAFMPCPKCKFWKLIFACIYGGPTKET